jgi:hypothetical protein
MQASHSIIGALLIMPTLATPTIACNVIGGSAEAGAMRRGDACAITVSRRGPNSVGLSEAEVLGAGFGWQKAFDGNACEAEEHAILIDCNADQAVVVGPHQNSVQGIESAGGKWFDAVSDLHDFATNSAPSAGLSLDVFAQRGASISLSDAVFVDLDNRIDLNGQLLGLSCACRLFYPDSAGARN